MTEKYYVHHNGAAVFVKEAEFFKDQGGFTSEWGKAWRGPIEAESVEDARVKGTQLFKETPNQKVQLGPCRGTISHDWRTYCQGCGAPFPGTSIHDASAPSRQNRGAPEWPPGSRVDFMLLLHQANASRGKRWHPSGLVSWSLSDWFTALAGEVGELGNVVKKLNRARDGLKGNQESERDLRLALGKEAADIFIYLELFAQVAGFDLVIETVRKFNEVSERNGFPERL